MTRVFGKRNCYKKAIGNVVIRYWGRGSVQTIRSQSLIEPMSLDYEFHECFPVFFFPLRSDRIVRVDENWVFPYHSLIRL